MKLARLELLIERAADDEALRANLLTTLRANPVEAVAAIVATPAKALCLTDAIIRDAVDRLEGVYRERDASGDRSAVRASIDARLTDIRMDPDRLPGGKPDDKGHSVCVFRLETANLPGFELTGLDGLIREIDVVEPMRTGLEPFGLDARVTPAAPVAPGVFPTEALFTAAGLLDPASLDALDLAAATRLKATLLDRGRVR